MQEYRPPWGSLSDRTNNSTKQSPTTTHTITIKQIQKHECNNPLTHPKTFNEHNTTTQHRKRPIRQKALQGRHSCIAQGGMRAKPDMEPWVNTDKRMKRALQGQHLPTQTNAPTSTKYCHTHQDDYICVVQNIIQYGTIHFSTLCAFSFSYCI